MRVGLGYDVHKIEQGRKLVLGGVQIPCKFGLLGHSDADVLVHSVMDSLLGAAALGDIGSHFPDTDPAYKGADSILLLKRVYHLLKENGFSVGNVDAVVAAQAPKLAPYIEEMRKNIAAALNTDISRISIKATTTERLGFEGRGEGISSYCVSLINEDI